MSEGLPRILVIEDHKAYLETMVDVLRTLPAEVDKAENGREAVTLLAEAYRTSRLYDLVVVDMYVPREPGEQISLDEAGNPVPAQAQKFGIGLSRDFGKRLQLLSPTTPMIVYTQYPSLEDRRICIRAGAFDYLPKKNDEGEDQLPLLLERCREALRCSEAPDDPFIRWFRENQDEIIDRYGGRTVALVQKDIARRLGLSEKPVGEYVLIVGEDDEEVRKRIIEDKDLIWLSPQIVNIPTREDVEL